MKKQGNCRKKVIQPGLKACILAFLVLMFFPHPSQAQSSPAFPVSIPDSSAFPKITFFFWPTDASGNFISNLSIDQVQVSENGRTVKLESLDLLEPGTHLIFAINEGPTLANSYAGKTRMDGMKEALTTWAKSESITTLDDFSLVTNTGVIQNKLSKPADWVQAIANYVPDLRKASPSMNSLSQAFSIIEGLPATDHQARAILYITPLPTKDQLTEIQTKAEEAVKDNVRLFIWLIGPPAYASEGAAAALQQDAASTGGNFFIYSGAETLPDLNTYFNPLSHEYQVTYQTTIQKSGTYTLQVSIKQNNFEASSNKVSFDLKAEAPNPIFLSPPSSITLNWQQTGEKKTWTVAPSLYTVNYMVEFPDGHQRDLTTAQLFVDGKLESEETSAPFNALKWNLNQYSVSGTHFIQLFVTDSAGFNASTIKTPVLITVNPKPQTALQKLLEKINTVTLAIAGFLVILGIGLFLFFRRLFLKKRGLLKKRRKLENDPVKQTVISDQTEVQEMPANDIPVDWPRLPGGFKAPARLLPIPSNNAPHQYGKAIPLPLQDTSFGSDSMRNDIVLSGPTIAPVHARIFTDNARHFYIADCGSSAGTWINYAPVSQQGGRLEHGDLINIGALSYRFEEVKPEDRPIQVMPYNAE